MRLAFCLAEHRQGGIQPFLVPKDIYLEFAKVVAKQTESFSFDEIYKAVQKTTPDCPDYLLRTSLRFW